MIEGFTSWLTRIQPDMDHVFKILSERLSDEPEELISDLRNAEAWNARVGTLLAEANSWLDRMSYQSKPDRDYGTEMDRRLKMENETADIRMMRDKIESLCDSIKQRLIMGQSILKYQTQFIEPKVANSIKPSTYRTNDPPF